MEFVFLNVLVLCFLCVNYVHFYVIFLVNYVLEFVVFTQRRKVFASKTRCSVLFFMTMERVLVNAACVTKVDCQ